MVRQDSMGTVNNNVETNSRPYSIELANDRSVTLDKRQTDIRQFYFSVHLLEYIAYFVIVYQLYSDYKTYLKTPTSELGVTDHLLNRRKK